MSELANNIQEEKFEIEHPLKELTRKFIKKKAAVVSLIFLLILVVIAIVRPAPYDISIPDYDNILSPPTSTNWFGTDEYGRDIFSRMIHGTRLSLSVALVGVTVS